MLLYYTYFLAKPQSPNKKNNTPNANTIQPKLYPTPTPISPKIANMSPPITNTIEPCSSLAIQIPKRLTYPIATLDLSHKAQRYLILNRPPPALIAPPTLCHLWKPKEHASDFAIKILTLFKYIDFSKMLNKPSLAFGVRGLWHDYGCKKSSQRSHQPSPLNIVKRPSNLNLIKAVANIQKPSPKPSLGSPSLSGFASSLEYRLATALGVLGEAQGAPSKGKGIG
jgi:hypothetical protein